MLSWEKVAFIKYVNILKHSFNILKSIWKALKKFTNSEYLHSHTHTQTNTHASTKNRNYIVQIPKKIDFKKKTDKPIYQVHVRFMFQNYREFFSNTNTWTIHENESHLHKCQTLITKT